MHTAAPPSAPGLRICRHSPQNPGRNSQPSSDMILNPLIKQCIAHLPHARDDSTKRDRSTCAFLGPTVGEETFLVAQGIESAWQCRRKPGSIPGSARLSGEGQSSPVQYSCLGNPMDRGAWRATVHGVAKSQTQLSD